MSVNVRTKEAVLYHICTPADWPPAPPRRHYRGTALDRRDGFIHLSTADQLPGTAARHFAGRDELIVLAVDAARLFEETRESIANRETLRLQRLALGPTRPTARPTKRDRRQIHRLVSKSDPFQSDP